MNAVVLDPRLDPIFVWRVHGAPTDADVDLFLATQSELLARGERWLTVIDARAAAPPTPAQLARKVAFVTTRAAALAEASLGVALVIPCQPLRRALVHMTAWRALPVAHALCPHMAAAMLWAEAQLLRAAA